jgi:hypothetical protein
MNSVRGEMAILIAELDSEWGDWLSSLRCEADDVLVLVQRPSESSPAFAARVRARVQDVRDGEIVAAALVGGNHCDAGVIGARSSMLHAVVSQMVTVGRGQVFLDGGSGWGRARHSMQAIADALEEQVAHTGVDVFTSGVEALRNAA